jgi:tight adherence protein B
MRVWAAGAGALACGVAAAVAGWSALLIAMAGLVGALAGATIYRRLRENWMKKLDRQFVQALGLMASAMRAGQTLPQSMETARPLLPRPIADEFAIMTRQFRLGDPVADVLGAFELRLGGVEARQAARAMIFAVGTGANLPGIFTEIVDLIRGREAVERKIETLTALGRGQSVFLALLPAGFLAIMAVVSPDHVRILFTTPSGNLALAALIALQVTMFTVVRRVTTIQV